MAWLEVAGNLGALVSGVGMLLIFWEFRQLRLRAEKGFLLAANVTRDDSSRAAGTAQSTAGCAIYVYRNGHWALEADLSKPGYEAAPPGAPGSYEGQVIKRESLPKSSWPQ